MAKRRMQCTDLELKRNSTELDLSSHPASPTLREDIVLGVEDLKQTQLSYYRIGLLPSVLNSLHPGNMKRLWSGSTSI
jgi:hypothetical protein